MGGGNDTAFLAGFFSFLLFLFPPSPAVMQTALGFPAACCFTAETSSVDSERTKKMFWQQGVWGFKIFLSLVDE